MKMTLALVVVGILAALAAATTSGLKSTSQPTSTSPYLAPHCNTADDRTSAYCEFAALTNATVEWREKLPASQASTDNNITKNPPLWAYWKDKCGLLLTPCAQGRVQPDHRIPLTQSDLFAASFATQILQSNPGLISKKHILKASDVQGIQLASVLFSPEMEDEARRLNNKTALDLEWQSVVNKTGPQREISTQLNSYSTVTKLIWEVVIPGSSHVPAYVYEKGLVPNVAGGGTELIQPGRWPTQYVINRAPDAPCDLHGMQNNLPMPKYPHPPTISVNCFFHYPVDTTDGAIWSMLTDDLHRVVLADSGAGSVQSRNAFLILVGAHVMRFDENHKLWQWMTFYWTPKVDATTPSSWKNPWKHYHMETTAVAQEGIRLIQEPIANPYLEGHNDTNGMSTNCLSCHSLAAYSLAGGKSGQAKALVDNTSCDPTNDTPCYLATENTANPRYYDDAVLTHFLWSIPTNPCLPQIPPTPSTVQQLCPVPQQTQQSHTDHKQAVKPN